MTTQSNAIENTIDTYIRDHEFTVTTPRDVYSWTTAGYKHLFHSETKGILAATRISAGTGLLAVSDGHGVLLYDPKGITPRQHKLHGKKDRIHCLHYDELSHRLFFTTSMRNAVQCFSTVNFGLLQPAALHPSPPAVFAFSAALNVILSASIKPSLMLLNNLTKDEPPLIVDTNCSRMPVTSAAFQPSTGTVLALGFMDGTVAVYEIQRMPSQNGSENHSNHFLKVKEKGHLRRLHSFASRNTTSDCSIHNGSSSDSAPYVRPGRDGNISLAFAPDSVDLLVTAGPDGRCFVIEYDPFVRVRTTYDVGAPVSSLTLVMRPTTDVMSDPTIPSDILMAFGRVDGVITFAKVNGEHVADVALDELEPVIGLDCVPLDSSFSTAEPGTLQAQRQHRSNQCRRADQPDVELEQESTSELRLDGELGTNSNTNQPTRVSNNICSSSPTKSEYYTPQSSPTKDNSTVLRKISGRFKKRSHAVPQIPDRTCSQTKRSDVSSRDPPKRTSVKIAISRSNASPSSQSDKDIAASAIHFIAPYEDTLGNNLKGTKEHDQIIRKDFWHSADLNGPALDENPVRAVTTGWSIHGDTRSSSAESISTLSNDTIIAWDIQATPNESFTTTPAPISSTKSRSPIPRHPPPPFISASARAKSMPATSNVDKALRPAPLSFRLEPKPVFLPRPTPESQSIAKDRHLSNNNDPSQATAEASLELAAQRLSSAARVRSHSSAKVETLPATIDRDGVTGELQEGFTAIRDELRTQLAEQREWFEGALKDHVGERLLDLNQRNRILKLELFRLRGRKG